MSFKNLSAAFIVLLVVVAAPSVASAAPIVVFGNTNGALATATGTLTYDGIDEIVLNLTNTSPFDARITGLGFDVFAGNANGYTGTSSDANFVFTDLDPGNVAQFNLASIDFAYLTGANFNGGSPNDGLAPGGNATFTVTGNFGALTEAEIAAALYVRFQRVGEDGELSDVGRSTDPCPVPGTCVPDTHTVVPEPASMLLLGTGLLAAARAARRRKTN